VAAARIEICEFMDILHQLGSLIVSSVPTMILFLLLVVAYNLLVRRPLERTLAERRARTTGAMEQARGAIAAAEAETSVYESKLRAARAQIQAEREQRMKARQAERDRAVTAAREQAQSRVATAKNEIEASAEAARRQIESAVDELGDRIVRAILPRGAAEQIEVRQ
jgi:F-type H+-transporting ATPase subunit b